MRAVVQRVKSAGVVVAGQQVASIGKGLLVLVGIDRNDEPSDAATLIKKILSVRLWPDESDAPWKKTVRDVDGEVLCVSQFTLHAKFKGAKPDFHESMGPGPGKEVYTSFMLSMRQAYDTNKVQEGIFGAMMEVSLINDGPLTFNLDTREAKTGSTAPSTSGSGTATPVGDEKAKAKAEKEAKAAEIKAKKEARKAEIEAKTLANQAKKEQKDREFEARREAGSLASGVKDLKVESS